MGLGSLLRGFVRSRVALLRETIDAFAEPLPSTPEERIRAEGPAVGDAIADLVGAEMAVARAMPLLEAEAALLVARVGTDEWEVAARSRTAHAHVVEARERLRKAIEHARVG